jgi:fibrillarin-like pre-rRNA processing protein
VPGVKIYGEQLVKQGSRELRVWDIYRSKLAAAIKKKLRTFPFEEKSKILYLGAGNGTTPSHIADIIRNGIAYCIEFSPRAMADLYTVCLQRKNLIPILADANKPFEYMNRVGQVDIIYEDVAQRGQVDILKKNAKYFLKPEGYAFLMVKARSIDVSKEPEKVFNIVADELRSHFQILERIPLDPYEKDHMCIVCKFKSNVS